MYICKPERSVKQTKLLLFVCVAVTMALFFFSSLNGSYSGLFRLCGFLSLTISIMLVVRFSLTEYEYIISCGDFSVVKITGNRRQVVLNIALETAISLISKKDYSHLPSSEKAILKYSLNQNMKAESYIFLFEFNKKRSMVEFEPNPEFISIMHREIELAKKHGD